MTKPPAKESRTKREDSLPTICFDLGDKVSLGYRLRREVGFLESKKESLEKEIFDLHATLVQYRTSYQEESALIDTMHRFNDDISSVLLHPEEQ